MTKYLKLLSLAVGAVACSVVMTNAGHTPVDPVGPIFVPVDPQNHTAVDDTGPILVPVFPSPATLFDTAKDLRETAQFCSALPEEYIVDCMSERFAAIASQLPATPETAEVKAVLEETSRKLKAVAQANRDPSKPRINARTEGAAPKATTRPLTPVAPASTETAKAEALAILDEAQTILLRSSEGSQERAAQFVEIADAIESNKVLLRS